VLQKMKDTKITNPADIMSKLFMLERLDVSLKDVTFNYQEESFGTVLGRALLDIGVLAIMTLLFFAAAYVAFMRYDVR
jgi:ABC-type transport system involved in multi-copper enzyme maturation permease subunit